jgi:hypothetical protein
MGRNPSRRIAGSAAATVPWKSTASGNAPGNLTGPDHRPRLVEGEPLLVVARHDLIQLTPTQPQSMKSQCRQQIIDADPASIAQHEPDLSRSMTKMPSQPLGDPNSVFLIHLTCHETAATLPLLELFPGGPRNPWGWSRERGRSGLERRIFRRSADTLSR